MQLSRAQRWVTGGGSRPTIIRLCGKSVCWLEAGSHNVSTFSLQGHRGMCASWSSVSISYRCSSQLGFQSTMRSAARTLGTLGALPHGGVAFLTLLPLGGELFDAPNDAWQLPETRSRLS
jgi:hypothetical protein